MKIKVNGVEKTIAATNPSVLDLLALEKVDIPDYVSVQINGAFAQRKDYATVRVAEDDEVDFLYFMGGGL
jgi:sulfur carrier protein